jgi:hypothetical protein
VGEPLRAPLRFLCGSPRWTVRQEAVACLRHRRFVPGALYLAIPAIRVVRKGEGSTTLFAPPASTEHVPTHLSTGAFSAPRMRTTRGLLDLVLPSSDRVDL